MTEDALPYLVGGSFGLVAFLAVTSMVRVPRSFAPFAVRSIATILGASAVGFLLADRYTGSH